MLERNNLKNLDSFLQSKVDAGEVAGSMLCIVYKGHEAYRKEFGMADISRKIPMQHDSIFRCYSMTKPVTSVAVMTLVENGVISLDDPVSRYISSFKNQRVLKDGEYIPTEREVTIEDLLDMTGGVVYPDVSFPAGAEMQKVIDAYYEDVEAGKPLDTIGFANMVGRQPLEFQPGHGWRYSFSADVLGAVVEAASGMRFSDYLKKTIFDPLGMTDTDFYVPDEKKDRFTEVYEWNDKQKKLVPWTFDRMLGLTYRFYKKPEFESGGAGLVSTIDDYKKITGLLMGKGTYDGIRILGRKTVDYMTCDHLKNEEERAGYNWEQLKGYGYGNLMRQMITPYKNNALGTPGEFGWDGFLGCYMAVDPAEELELIYVIQKCGGNGFRDISVIKNIVYGALD